jgi:hypothetical protein
VSGKAASIGLHRDWAYLHTYLESLHREFRYSEPNVHTRPNLLKFSSEWETAAMDCLFRVLAPGDRDENLGNRDELTILCFFTKSA